MHPAYTIFPLGDSALTIEFGNKIDVHLNQKVLQLFKRLQQFSPFIKDIIPAYSSLTVCYDILSLHTKDKTAFEAMSEMIVPVLTAELPVADDYSRQLRIPVCYDEIFALDLKEVALQKSISTNEVIRLHTARTYRVYMIGFLPGFPYMGQVDERIATPRKVTPRKAVAAGSVGIAGGQTGIYSLTSPGGWNIIGKTPLKIFSAIKVDAAMFQPGDEVSFYSITKDEFENYSGGNL